MGVGREKCGARSRHLLHAGRQMRCLPDSGVVHVEIAVDRADHNFSRVQADSDLNWHTLQTLKLRAIAIHGLLHSERRVAGSDGVILVGHRRTEERHYAVAHDLVDDALVTVNSLHHQFEHRIQNLPRLLRVAVSEQLHGSLEVGEEHRHLLALTFEGTFRGDNPLGEVLGNMRLA